jgi:hypothetical protein
MGDEGKLSDLMYLGDDAANDQFKSMFSAAFPEAKMEEEWDEIHEWRASIEYDHGMQDRIMEWLIRNGWGGCSFKMNLMLYGDAKEVGQVRKWIDASRLAMTSDKPKGNT